MGGPDSLHVGTVGGPCFSEDYFGVVWKDELPFFRSEVRLWIYISRFHLRAEMSTCVLLGPIIGSYFPETTMGEEP